MNDSEYSARWRALAAQLREVERIAGIGSAASGLRDEARLPTGGANEFKADEPKNDGDGNEHDSFQGAAPLGALQRRELRALYFGVVPVSLRKTLIAKQRELELFARTGARTNLEEARRDFESIRRRPAEGWWIAAIVGAGLVIVGYELFAVLGAISGGIAALFVGNGVEQGMRRRYEHAVALAQEDVLAADAAVAVSVESRDLFSEGESATGEPDLEPATEHRRLSVAHALPPAA